MFREYYILKQDLAKEEIQWRVKLLCDQKRNNEKISIIVEVRGKVYGNWVNTQLTNMRMPRKNKKTS